MTDFDPDSGCKDKRGSNSDFDSEEKQKNNKNSFPFVIPGKILKIWFPHIHQFPHCTFHLSSLNLSPFFFFVRQFHHISGLLVHLIGSSPWLFVIVRVSTNSTLSAFRCFSLGLILVILPQVLPYWEDAFHLKVLPQFCCIYCNNFLL